MNKKLIIFLLIITSILVFIGIARTQSPKNLVDRKKTIFESKNTTEAEEKKQIAENIKKYQPQKSINTKTEGLELSAKSAILVDENNNQIIYQKNPNEKLPPASITKIATISVALEQIKANDLITISEKAAGQEPNKIVMKAGEKLKLDDLLYGLMMISANDAAFAIAEAIPGGYDRFINLMNEKVKMLGLIDTKFKNPSGLDEEGHYSSVFDIASLTRYALLVHPEFVNYAGEKNDHQVFQTDYNESHWWSHISGMLYKYPGMIAAKTGYTEAAKSTFIGVAERNGKKITVVIMGSTDANADIPRLLDFGFGS